MSKCVISNDCAKREHVFSYNKMTKPLKKYFFVKYIYKTDVYKFHEIFI